MVSRSRLLIDYKIFLSVLGFILFPTEAPLTACFPLQTLAVDEAAAVCAGSRISVSITRRSLEDDLGFALEYSTACKHVISHVENSRVSQEKFSSTHACDKLGVTDLQVGDVVEEVNSTSTQGISIEEVSTPLPISDTTPFFTLSIGLYFYSLSCRPGAGDSV